MTHDDILATLERQAQVFTRLADRTRAIDISRGHKRAAAQLRFVASLTRQGTYEDQVGEAWVVAARVTIRNHMARESGLVRI